MTSGLRKDAPVSHLLREPEMAPLRGDPRFRGHSQETPSAIEHHHSSFAPTPPRGGGTILSGRRNDEPDDQLVFCSGLAFRRLKTSMNPASRRCLPRRKPFSTRTSSIVMLSIRRVLIGSASIRTLP